MTSTVEQVDELVEALALPDGDVRFELAELARAIAEVIDRGDDLGDPGFHAHPRRLIEQALDHLTTDPNHPPTLVHALAAKRLERLWRAYLSCSEPTT